MPPTTRIFLYVFIRNYYIEYGLLKINLRFSEHLYMYMYVHGLVRHKRTHYKGTTCIHVCAHQSFFAGHNLKIAQLSTVAIRPFCKGS